MTWAANFFEKVWTIEATPEFYHKAVAAHGHRPNITFLLGNATDQLRTLIPALFFLDAHWIGVGVGADRECPVLEEIGLINGSAFPHLVVIDDARLFLAPPIAPHNADHWPSIAEVGQALAQGPARRQVAVLEDNIVAIPWEERGFFTHYSRQPSFRQPWQPAPGL